MAKKHSDNSENQGLDSYETIEEYGDTPADEDELEEVTRVAGITESSGVTPNRPNFYRPLLIGLSGPDKGVRYSLNNHMTVVGRSSSCTWKLNDHASSRQHFKITFENHIAPDQMPVCIIEDLQSKNGTDLNGSKITEPVVLNERDRISLGSTVIGFFIRDDDEMKQDHSLYLNATQDPLTGLKNRRMLQEYIKYHMRHAQKYNLPLSLLMFDIDFFKKVNDTYGHDVGDDALCHVARMMQDNCRDGDLLARWGGEEFAMAMSGNSAPAAEKLGERLRQYIEATPLAMDDGNGELLFMTISIGGSEFKPGDTMESLFQRADSALYEAKRNGRNRIVFNSNK